MSTRDLRGRDWPARDPGLGIPLLQDVSGLMGEHHSALRGIGLIGSLCESNVTANGKGLGSETCGQLCRLGIAVNPHIAEARAESGLHPVAGDGR